MHCDDFCSRIKCLLLYYTFKCVPINNEICKRPLLLFYCLSFGGGSSPLFVVCRGVSLFDIVLLVGISLYVCCIA